MNAIGLTGADLNYMQAVKRPVKTVDYGFVGAGKQKVNLYKGLKPIKRHIPYESAVEELEQLIRENGDWKDPED